MSLDLFCLRTWSSLRMRSIELTYLCMRLDQCSRMGFFNLSCLRTGCLKLSCLKLRLIKLFSIKVILSMAQWHENCYEFYVKYWGQNYKKLDLSCDTWCRKIGLDN